MLPDLKIADYTYPLPDERIARFPAAQRDRAKLLTCAGGTIGETVFAELPALLPPASLLVFNETKVIPARLLFRKDTGAHIELFCLEPLQPADYEQCFAHTATCVWKCVAGNGKRWKAGTPLALPFGGTHTLQAELLEKYDDCVAVRFRWNSAQPFAQVLEQCGATPIPPYLKRAATAFDTEHYQTVYARYRGSVAAPTAGLHFTAGVLQAIAARDIPTEKITLHVGAGTFRPVKSATIAGHTMHSEPFTVTHRALQSIIDHAGRIIAVGTTSARALESLYYLGLQCMAGKTPAAVSQWEACETPAAEVPPAQALQALADYLQANRLDALHATTQILIAPPCRFRLVQGLITNFHQPQSTLLLLIAALIGNRWREVYDYALRHNFRFLSYGDSSLLLS